MIPTPVIAVFDIGKTNKKIILFDEQYTIVNEQSKEFLEISDEDGDACEDIRAITLWIKDTVLFLSLLEHIEIRAINISAYGASFVYLNEAFEITAPLYNYLKPYPKVLEEQFYGIYGGEMRVARETASPVLGSLNSGLQVYRLKYQSPQVYQRIKYALHLPQYVSHVITSKVYSEITSIGSHTHLWDFEKNHYHDWVTREGLDKKFPPMMDSDAVIKIQVGQLKKQISVGSGLHDSSAALIPYLASFPDPFVLISTGTWCISLNPFNSSPLTDEELKKDCLCYLSYQGKPVKASRIFAGHDHEVQTKRLSAHFNKKKDFYKSVKFNPALADSLRKTTITSTKKSNVSGLVTVSFETADLSAFSSYEEAYHKLLIDIIDLQKASTELVLKNTSVKKIFVDGGFSKNPVFMNLLSAAFPRLEICGATIAQASALGAALAIHSHWNNQPIPKNLIALERYPN